MRSALLLSLALLLHACGDEVGCTLIGCSDGFTLQPELGGATWPAGAYRIVFEVDGETVTCTGALPLPACGTGNAITCDRAGVVTIGEVACDRPASEHALGPFEFPGAPASVTVEIHHDGSSLLRQTFTPSYQTLQPNGPGCPPICTRAADTFALPID